MARALELCLRQSIETSPEDKITKKDEANCETQKGVMMIIEDST
jgi:hypothetical protein